MKSDKLNGVYVLEFSGSMSGPDVDREIAFHETKPGPVQGSTSYWRDPRKHTHEYIRRAIGKPVELRHKGKTTKPTWIIRDGVHVPPGDDQARNTIRKCRCKFHPLQPSFIVPQTLWLFDPV